jgi:hypothetical protein
MALTRQAADERVEPLSVTARDGYRGAMTRRTRGDGRTDASGSAGDEDPPTIEPEEIVLRHRPPL